VKPTRRKTGEKPAKNIPLKIDRLPQAMRDRILAERNMLGRSWEEIEQDSPSWDEWKKIDDGDVLKLFPGKRLPHSNLHRWYDLRVAQVQRDVLAKAEQAREIAAVFAKAVVSKSDEAVLNAARDLIFSLLQRPDGKTQETAAKALLALGEIMQVARANDIKERKVAVDEKKLKALEAREELTRRKLEKETEDAAKKIQKGDFGVEDINRLRQRVFGLPPVSAK
jgi:autonomous glycyl radical cofactor GrcA